MSYRNDIDGMRAIAVLLVVLYHCGFSSLVHGGFVGVDVFFVISGFLITNIIYKQATAGTFSIWEFYERRVRRIFPAILVVYACTLIASFIILMPSETTQMTRNALSSMAFISNIYFYLKFDYFDATSEFNALLHTWSLSVEEQFYIFTPPIVVFFCAYYPRALKPAIIVTAMASLALAQWRLSADQSAAFYLVQYRAWELLAGAMLAVGIVPQTSSRIVANAGAIIGILLIAASARFLTSSTPFPGMTAVPAVLGASLLIWSGTNHKTFVGWWLSIPPARFVGWISYSLYLWHWPVWVLGTQVFEPRGPVQKLAFVAIAFVAATLSWYFVERPFRKTNPGTTSPIVVGRGLVAMVVVAIAAVATPMASSAYWQVSPEIERVAAFINYRADNDFRAGTCFLTSQFNEFSMFDRTACLSSSLDKQNVLLMGDSHAAHFYPGLAALKNVNIMQATASGCRAVDGTTGEARCTSLMRFVQNDFIPKGKVDTVIISSRWVEGDAAGLGKLIGKLKAHVDRVIVFGPIAEYDRALPRVLAWSMLSKDPALVDRHRLVARRKVDDEFRGVATAAGAEYVSVYDALCPDRHCTLWTADGNPIQSDYGHLTRLGSIEVMKRIDGRMNIARTVPAS